MATTTCTWVAHKATLTLEVTNFPAAWAAAKKGDWIQSSPCTLGGAQFRIEVNPSGPKDNDKVSVYLRNRSDVSVAADFTVMVADRKKSWTNVVFMSKVGWGWRDFIGQEDVGETLNLVAEITLTREEVIKVEDNLEKLTNEMTKMKLGMESSKEPIDRNCLMETINQAVETINIKQAEMMKKIDNIKEPIRIPECPICLEDLRPPLRIAQCQQGHKVCEPCSQREEVKGCPEGCQGGFMGRVPESMERREHCSRTNHYSLFIGQSLQKYVP